MKWQQMKVTVFKTTEAQLRVQFEDWHLQIAPGKKRSKFRLLYDINWEERSSSITFHK